MRRRPEPARLRAGFSIIELMGVIVVLGLLATIVVVSSRAMLPRAKLNAAVRNLASTIQKTRSDAIARNAEFRIEYDLDAEAYRVVTPYQLGGGLAASYEDRAKLAWNLMPGDVDLASVTIDGIEYVANPTEQGVYVRFDPLGASSAHTVLLHQAEYDNWYTIEVLALTGLVRFHEGIFQREPADEGSFE